MTKDFEYTLSMLKVFEDYDKIFDELSFVWMHSDVCLAKEHYPTCEAFNNIDWSCIQSMVLPQNLRYLVPYQKSKRMKEKDANAHREWVKQRGFN